MSLSYKVGSFSAASATGNHVITGVGFQPKALMFFVVPRTGDGSNSGCSLGIGAAVSSTQRGAAFFNSSDAAATSTVTIMQRGDACIVRASNTAVIYRADLVSMDSDGFTLNTVTADANTRTIVYLALGGTDVADVAVGNFQAPSSAGNQDVSLSFEPDTVLFFGCSLSATLSTVQSNQNAHFGIGVANSASERGYFASYDEHNNATNAVCKRKQRQDAAYEIIGASASLAKFDYVQKNVGGGFRINWSAVDAAQPYVFYLAIKGPKLKLKSFTQPTGATGSQATTGVGFLPRALLLLSHNRDASANIEDHLRLSVGLAVSSTERAALWAGDQNAQATQWTNVYLDSTKAIKLLTETSTNPTLNAEADLVSMDSDGFTLNWSTIDATAREILALAIGDAAVASPGSATFTARHEALGVGAGKTWTHGHEGLVPSTGAAGTVTQVTRRIRKVRKVR